MMYLKPEAANLKCIVDRHTFPGGALDQTGAASPEFPGAWRAGAGCACIDPAGA